MIRPIDPPTFEGAEAARVLIEATDWADRASMAAMIRLAGHEVVTCPGPEAADRTCDLAATGACRPADTADVVVHALRHGDARNLDVLRDLRRRHPELPVIVEAPELATLSWPDDYEGCTVLSFPVSPSALTAALAEALAGCGRQRIGSTAGGDDR